MNRLLQGDVGAGKTIVALARGAGGHGERAPGCVHGADRDPGGAAFREHLAAAAVVALSPGAADGHDRPRSARRDDLAEVEAGTIHLVIGTHALVEGDVRFHQLGLVIIDEQHRFGVLQRASLRTKRLPPGRARHDGDTDPAHARVDAVW